MKLLIMRHGSAEEGRCSDFSRQLTQRGIEQVVRSIAALGDKEVVPGKIFASPLVRAQETARLVSDKMSITATIQTMDEINPAGKPVEVVKKLQDIANKQLCLLVSHQPFVSIFVEYLTSQEMYMDTSDIACISMLALTDKKGTLEWFIHV